MRKNCLKLATSYNSHLGNMRLRGLTSFITRIPENEIAFQDHAAVQAALNIIHKCYEELGLAIGKECPERELLEGERFKFAWRFEKAPRSEPFQPALFSI